MGGRLKLSCLRCGVENGFEGETEVRETNDYSVLTTKGHNSSHLLSTYCVLGLILGAFPKLSLNTHGRRSIRGSCLEVTIIPLLPVRKWRL